MLNSSTRFNLIYHYGRNGIERVVFLYVVSVYGNLASFPCLVTFPIRMDVNVGNAASVIFFFEAAVLKWDMLYLTYLTSKIVVYMECKAIIHSDVLCDEGEYVINHFSLSIADVFCETCVAQPVTLNECLITLQTSATCGAIHDEVAHPLWVQVIRAIRLNVQLAQIRSVETLRRS